VGRCFTWFIRCRDELILRMLCAKSKSSCPTLLDGVKVAILSFLADISLPSSFLALCLRFSECSKENLVIDLEILRIDDEIPQHGLQIRLSGGAAHQSPLNFFLLNPVIPASKPASCLQHIQTTCCASARGRVSPTKLQKQQQHFSFLLHKFLNPQTQLTTDKDTLP
jgi:hypothetical protein